jgi:hypothetical protein
LTSHRESVSSGASFSKSAHVVKLNSLDGTNQSKGSRRIHLELSGSVEFTLLAGERSGWNQIVDNQ